MLITDATSTLSASSLVQTLIHGTERNSMELREYLHARANVLQPRTVRHLTLMKQAKNAGIMIRKSLALQEVVSPNIPKYHVKLNVTVKVTLSQLALPKSLIVSPTSAGWMEILTDSITLN